MIGWAIRARRRGRSGARALGPAGLALAVLLAVVTGAVPDPNIDPVPVLRKARRDHDNGKLQKALARLAVLEESELADHVALLRTRILREQGRAEEASAAARRGLGRDPPSQIRARLEHQIAAIAIERGELIEAYAAQRRAWESSRDPEKSAELMAELARVFDERMLPGDALKLYWKVWQTWPLAEASAAAYERSQMLVRATGAKPPETRALLRYAHRQRESAHCKRALPVYEQVLARDPLEVAERASADRGRADCLFDRRRYLEAATAYRLIAEADPDDSDAAIRVARSWARAGRNDAAVGQFDRVARAKQTSRAARARANYLKAVVIRTSEPVRAESLFREVERQRSASGLSRMARWRLAWSDLRRGDYAAALPRLDVLSRGSKWDVEVQRARYWRAVAHLQTDRSAGRGMLRELTETLPLSYYGVVAADRLDEESALERSFVGDRPRGSVQRPALRARWLMEGGYPDLARDEIDSWLRTRKLDRAARIAAAQLLHELGDYFRGVRTVVDGFGGALEQGIDPEWREAWQLAWPRPFDPTVRSATEEFEFDAALVWAVMREESTYRPDIASPAGAIGLMQIIPPTGDQIAGYLGVDRFETDRLREPVTNIRFGTFYLKRLVGRFQGSQPLAIAAYNAGPDVVSSWIKRDGKSEHDVFVESVPYSETRRYLRRVIRSQRIYQLLYDE